MEQLEAEAEKVAEHHEAEKALLERAAEMQRQQYESQLKQASQGMVGGGWPAVVGMHEGRQA